MALKRLFCSGCGLEILKDQRFIPWKHSDIYHDYPYNCYPYPAMPYGDEDV